MSEISEFYTKMLSDETIRKEIVGILGDHNLETADDEQLIKIGEIAAKLGYQISLEDAKTYLEGEEAELDEDDLDAVAGGKGIASLSCTEIGSVQYGDDENQDDKIDKDVKDVFHKIVRVGIMPL